MKLLNIIIMNSLICIKKTIRLDTFLLQAPFHLLAESYSYGDIADTQFPDFIEIFIEKIEFIVLAKSSQLFRTYFTIKRGSYCRSALT